jgi:hypothetical protein
VCTDGAGRALPGLAECGPAKAGRTVGLFYWDAVGDTLHRNHAGYGATCYTNTTGRNDLKSVKVAHGRRKRRRIPFQFLFNSLTH